MGLTQRVQYLGGVNTMAEVYASAAVLIHPTLEDTCGMVVLEAMAHGLAVVVSQANYCGIAAELQHGVNAQLLEDPHNAQSIADAVMQLADALLYNNHRVNAQAFAKQHLWVDAAAQYEAIFEQLTAP
jgi:UDP-glucose:(heptosyl)LPS alpha-1,3-glucosyltransferase